MYICKLNEAETDLPIFRITELNDYCLTVLMRISLKMLVLLMDCISIIFKSLRPKDSYMRR